jgi:diketogulonate reductase-like aldo/keto reductase
LEVVLDAIGEYYKLNNGVLIPRLGLGVYQSAEGQETETAVAYALEIGYRLIDTASVYGNEKDVGRAVKSSRIPREDLFITTKVWNSDQGYDTTLAAFHKSLAKLAIDYIDLYLIHWPATETRLQTWRALEELYRQGLCRSIGVSNFQVEHLEELLKNYEVVPAVNQVEFSPFLYQKRLLDYCSSKAIKLEAYSPLTQGKKLSNRVIIRLANKYGRTPAQILIRWALQHELVVIPKSVHRRRIKENFEVSDFEIAAGDMARLDKLDSGFRACWDPTGLP